jgi:hypothetical protein
MSVQPSNIIPWGRSFKEYELMFGLTESDLRSKILGCGDGPASFNAEMTRRGFSVVSSDPIYALPSTQILEQFQTSIAPVMAQVRAQPDNYVWSYHRSPEELLRCREGVIREFLADLPAGTAEGRYVVGELPGLPFAAGAFDLALCSHLLFLYSNVLSLDFHLQSILELCRVAREARIFPLTGLDCEPSPYLEPLQQDLSRSGLRTEIVKVNYQLQRNGNRMIRIFRSNPRHSNRG